MSENLVDLNAVDGRRLEVMGDGAQLAIDTTLGFLFTHGSARKSLCLRFCEMHVLVCLPVRLLWCFLLWFSSAQCVLHWRFSVWVHWLPSIACAKKKNCQPTEPIPKPICDRSGQLEDAEQVFFVESETSRSHCRRKMSARKNWSFR